VLPGAAVHGERGLQVLPIVCEPDFGGTGTFVSMGNGAAGTRFRPRPFGVRALQGAFRKMRQFCAIPC